MKKLVSLIKGLILLLGMLVCALISLIIGIPWWGTPKLNRIFITMFSWFARLLIGIDFEIRDLDKIYLRRPAVFLGNHQSAFDFALIGSISPSYSVVVGKREIIWIPILGWYFKLAGNLMIDRSNAKESRGQINALAEHLVQKNLTVSIFPEGTRNKKSNEELLPFKKGAFHIAFSKGLPVVPVVCSSLKGIAVWERLELNGGKVILKVLDPIDTQGVDPSQMDGFIEKVRTLMQEELNRLNAEVKNS